MESQIPVTLAQLIKVITKKGLDKIQNKPSWNYQTIRIHVLDSILLQVYE